VAGARSRILIAFLLAVPTSVDCGNILDEDGASDFSFCAWAKGDAENGVNGGMIEKADAGHVGWELDLSPHRMGDAYLYRGGAVNFDATPVSTWTHYCFTYDAGTTTVKTYQNGVYKNSAEKMAIGQ